MTHPSCVSYVVSDVPSYVVSEYPQRSPEWRKIVVVSSTDLGYLMGHDYQSMLKGDKMLGWNKVREKFDLGYRPEILNNPDLERGVRCEPIARQRLEKYLSQWWPVTVKEIGVAILNSQPLFGTSVDGIVYISGTESTWCVEIKCPRKMYDDLWGEITPTPLYEHIKREHYDQMQWHCYILNKAGCFYTVYIEDTEELFVQYVPRNNDYINILVATATDFLRHIKRL